MRSALIAGARPNFVKIAPLLRALREEGAEPLLVHTGQHYDRKMSDAFFADLDIPDPNVNLNVGSGAHAVQTAAIMLSFEEWLTTNEVDQVVTVGDVNSTLACTLVAAKREIPVAHVEAGLRSFDRTMPEEINRIVVDSLATWLFTPSADADDNLRAEGVDESRVYLVGNIMVDSLLAHLERARATNTTARLRLDGPYGVVTLHRPALVDRPEILSGVMRALQALGERLPLVFPVHPRTRARLSATGIVLDAQCIRLVEPLSYLEFLAVEAGASLVLTDSGGVQEETTVLGVPCLTLRENTERPVTVTNGTNRIVGLDPDAIGKAAEAALQSPPLAVLPPLWDGRTAERVASTLVGPAPLVSWKPKTGSSGQPTAPGPHQAQVLGNSD